MGLYGSEVALHFLCSIHANIKKCIQSFVEYEVLTAVLLLGSLLSTSDSVNKFGIPTFSLNIPPQKIINPFVKRNIP
jgi:hypothetical protein